MADVVDHAEVVAQRDRGVGLGQPGLLGDRRRGRVRVQVALEILDGFLGRLQEAVRLGLERELDVSSRVAVQPDQVRDDAQHLARVGFHDVRPRDPRLEAERRALDRGLDAGRGDLGEDVRDLHRVDGALLAAPVRLVDVLLDERVLERSVRERVDRVDVHVVVVQEALELLALGGVLRERLGGRGREPQRHAERRVRRHALLNARHERRQAVPHLGPRVAGMHERRVRQMAEAVAQIHAWSP